MAPKLRSLMVIASVLAAQPLPSPSPSAEAAHPPPGCRNGFYVVTGSKLTLFDENSDERRAVTDLSVQVNALAYQRETGEMQGVAAGRFVAVDSSGKVTDHGPTPDWLTGAFAATSDGPHWIVQSGGYLATLQGFEVVKKVPLAVELGDFDYNPADGQLYGVLAGPQAQLIRADPQTGVTSTVAPLPDLRPGSSYGAVAIDHHGILHALHNATGKLFHISLADPTHVTSTDLVPRSAGPVFHADAASCPEEIDHANLPGLEATHTVSTFGQLSLGKAVGVDDGLAQSVVIAAEATSLTLDVAVVNTTGHPALLAGWHDLDHDGQFGAGERATAPVPPGATVVTLTWPHVLVNPASDHSELRLRLYGSQPQDPQPIGSALGGEVEDYAVTVHWPEPAPQSPRPQPPRPQPVIVQPSPSPPPSYSPPPTRPAGIFVAEPTPPARVPLRFVVLTSLLVPAVTVAARNLRRRR